MKIRKYPVTVTILWIMIEILDIVFTVISFSRIKFSDKSAVSISNPHVFNTVILLLMFFAVFQFYSVMGHYVFSRKEIIFQCLFYRKHYRWKDFRYIVKLKKQRHIPDNKKDGDKNNGAMFLFSVTLDKDGISSIHSVKDHQGNFFRLPYSEKLEEIIQSNAQQYISDIDVSCQNNENHEN